MTKAQAFALHYGCMCARVGKDGKPQPDIKVESYLIRAIEDGENSFYTYKLRLRPVTAVTEEDTKVLKDLYGGDGLMLAGAMKRNKPVLAYNSEQAPQMLLQLVKMGFDLYGCREKGYAVYESEKHAA